MKAVVDTVYFLHCRGLVFIWGLFSDLELSFLFLIFIGLSIYNPFIPHSFHVCETATDRVVPLSVLFIKMYLEGHKTGLVPAHLPCVKVNETKNNLCTSIVVSFSHCP